MWLGLIHHVKEISGRGGHTCESIRLYCCLCGTLIIEGNSLFVWKNSRKRLPPTPPQFSALTVHDASYRFSTRCWRCYTRSRLFSLTVTISGMAQTVFRRKEATGSWLFLRPFEFCGPFVALPTMTHAHAEPPRSEIQHGPQCLSASPQHDRHVVTRTHAQPHSNWAVSFSGDFPT